MLLNEDKLTEAFNISIHLNIFFNILILLC